MADLAKRLVGPATLTNAAADQYTVPASTVTIVRHIRAHNRTSGPVDFTLSFGADGTGTRLWDAVTIPAKGSIDWSGFEVLAAAEKIQAFASANSSINLVVSGVETS
jgi:hypothetical protein